MEHPGWTTLFLLALVVAVRAQVVVDALTDTNLTNSQLPTTRTVQPVELGESCVSDEECWLLDPLTECRPNSTHNSQLMKCECRTTYVVVSGRCRLQSHHIPGTHVLAKASAMRVRIVLSQSQKTAIICATVAAVGGGILVLVVVLINKKKHSSSEQRKKRWILEHITVTPVSKY